MARSTYPADAGVETDSSVQPTPPVDRATQTSVAAPLSDSGKRTPEEWAEVFFPAGATGRGHDDAWKHAAAAALHGWWGYAARVGAPFLMDRAAYEGALAAASGNTFVAHAAADATPKKDSV